MSEIRLKDFILTDIPVPEKNEKVNKNAPVEYSFTLEYENDVDFILRRVTSRTDRSLVCIVSQGQIYIKDNKSTDIELVTTKDQILKFKSGMTPSQKPTFEKLIWKPFYVTSNWANGRYQDIVCVHDDFGDLLRDKTTFKVLANKKLDPFHNSSLVSEYKRNPEKFDDTIRLIDTVKSFYPQFSINYWSFSTVMNNLKALNFHQNTVNKYKEEFDALGETFLTLCKTAKFSTILTEYHVDFGTWLKWIVYTIINNNRLAITGYGSSPFSITDYEDFLRMQKEMYGKVKDKYPKYWLSEHQIVVGKYTDWKALRARIGFELNQEPMKKFEYENDTYKVIVPLMSSEIIDEAHQQQHCVASYVDKVARGDTHIVFIRMTENPEESVLTVEINTKDEVCQVRGFMNRDYTLDEYKFIKEWADATGLTLTIKEKKDETEV